MPTDHILVTGAGGFIGARLLERWRGQGRNVTPWMRAMGDLRDPAAVSAQLKAMRPDCIIHLAAIPPASGDHAWTAVGDDMAMLNTLTFAMRDDCRLLYTGSMAEYGRAGVLDERDACYPATPYGLGKYAATNAALALRLTHGFDVRVARLFGVYGPGEAQQRLIPTLIARLNAGQAVPLSDGRQIRDFVHVDDVCDTVATMIDAPALAFPLVNIGTGVGVSVRHVCEQVASLLGADHGLLQFDAIPRRTVDEDLLVANTDRLGSICRVPSQHWLSGGAALEYVRNTVQ